MFSVTSAFSNGQDTMVNLRFQDYGIVIWSIQNLQETTTKGVYLNRIKNRNFYFTSYTKQEVSPILEINYKLPDHPIKEMVINFSKETIISDTVRTVMNQGYYFKTRKLGISEPDKRSMIIFDFNKTTESAIFNVATSSRRYLTLIYKLNDGRFDIEIAKKILK